VRSVAADALGVARELLRWPARIWMAVAEGLGALFLRVWLEALLPALRVGWRLLRAGLAVAQRTVTPARGLAVVALAATIALGSSQFGDYRAVQVGAPEYAGVSEVAQPPEVDRASPRSAHGVWVFAIAVATRSVNWLSRASAFGASGTRTSPPADTTPQRRPSTTIGAPTPACTPESRAASPMAPATSA